GRGDGQVKIRGFRVEVGEVESALAEHPGVRGSVVVAHKPSGAAAARLVAYLVPSEEPVEASTSLGEELRAYLGSRLPEYMVPSLFVELSELPLTATGKVDRRSLPAPEGEAVPRGDAQAPRSEAERILTEIWSKVLAVPEVGVEDDFFSLGGDSILSIQITSRAQEAGLSISPRLIFEHPTVAQLALVAEAAGEATAPQEELFGAVPLVPIQKSFLEGDPTDLHHFNMPMLLAVEEALPPAVLEGALSALVRHHDALRLRFFLAEEGWRQEYGPVEGSFEVRTFDLSDLPPERWAEAVSEEGGRLQASLRLEGPLVRAAFFDTGGRQDRLLLVLHHLVVDGV
ncbi:MAG: non-ribosomal peptide synthetase, partial [Acidobacteria bacterium]|nr:non-ribosomal peptide synthetase [Acidobacteriota bacterium]